MEEEDKKNLATDAQINTEKLLVSGTMTRLFKLNECQMATSDTTETHSSDIWPHKPTEARYQFLSIGKIVCV
ncbi:hypothetical protein BCL90_2142 [Pedobacter alluvionis]|uniref:Uncharacterized protein n=1 Tax=Pedobacter alluvionis TaxID=475253 RepID=A0A497Y9V5_9SPHI|nr:hypothetical protein BCL90_2142 [Pedobacter alluvionis]